MGVISKKGKTLPCVKDQTAALDLKILRKIYVF